MYVAFRHGLHGLTNNLKIVLKKLTQGRRFWHGLHGLRIKLLKISPGWSFTSIREQIFLNTYVASGHGLHGLPNNV